MAENNPHLPPSAVNAPGHEPDDVNAWAVGKFAIALIIIVALSMVLLIGLFKYFQTSDQANPVVETKDPNQFFPEPRLERTPVPDLRSIRAEEDKVLSGYGWVDPQRGLVRIPIDVAIDALAKKGLPYRQNTASPSRDPADQSRESVNQRRDAASPSGDRKGAVPKQ
jgi:hypothetical protein